jgi:hypothetical protein
MFLLAYLPPLWFRVMNPRVLEVVGGDLDRINLDPSYGRERVLAQYPAAVAARAWGAAPGVDSSGSTSAPWSPSTSAVRTNRERGATASRRSPSTYRSTSPTPAGASSV